MSGKSKAARKRTWMRWYRSMERLPKGAITGPGIIDAWNHYAMFPRGRNPRRWRWR